MPTQQLVCVKEMFLLLVRKTEKSEILPRFKPKMMALMWTSNANVMNICFKGIWVWNGELLRLSLKCLTSFWCSLSKMCLEKNVQIWERALENVWPKNLKDHLFRPRVMHFVEHTKPLFFARLKHFCLIISSWHSSHFFDMVGMFI